MNKKIAALVPMKAVSERLPNKNLRDLDGKPLCYYILNELTKSKKINDIFVDTDSNEIKKYLKENFTKIKIIERPNELCGQLISFERIIEHDINIIDYEYFFQTFATSPLLSVGTIDKAIDVFLQNELQFDSLFSVTKLQKRLYDIHGNCLNPFKNIYRNQDLQPIFIQNASFFIFSKNSFSKANKRITDTPYMYELYGQETIDIDFEFDFELASLILSKNKK